MERNIANTEKPINKLKWSSKNYLLNPKEDRKEEHRNKNIYNK